MTTTEMSEMIRKLLTISRKGEMAALADSLEVCKMLEAAGSYYVDGQLLHDEVNFATAHAIVKDIRATASKLAAQGGDVALTVYKNSLLFDAPWYLDEAIRYAEFERPYKKRFYEPRRKQLLPVVRAMERLEAHETKLLLVMMPPGTGKSTLEIMFLRWFGGKHPEMFNLVGSHSASILQGMYGEIERMCQPDGEYAWNEIFPAPLVNTDAKNMRLDLETKKRFSTYQFASVGAGNAGRVRASGLLCLDDLVPDLESSMSRERMDKLWMQYNTDYLQRMIGDCVQLVIQTPWSLFDPIDRLAAMHENDPDTEIVRLPALNAEDESNFDYPFSLGFTTEKYHEIRDVMDDVSWRALYMLQPQEREGMLYAPEELRRYFDLPEREPDAIIAVCDSKEQGNDFCAMPIAYQYGDDYYIEKWICDNSKVEVVQERVIQALAEHNVQAARVESNRGGTIFADNLRKGLQERGARCHITTKWNQANKETRILMASAWVKSHCLFKDESLYKTDKEYATAMRELTSYTMSGRNPHDDVPDALADLENFTRQSTGNSVVIRKRPW